MLVGSFNIRKLGAALERHADQVELVIADGDQCYSDGVDTLNIWRHLNRTMRKEDGRLLPGEEAMRSWFRDVFAAIGALREFPPI